MAPTSDRARELLDYNPETGVFTWRTSGRRRYKGELAGRHSHSGYVKIYIDGKPYYNHRIAWLITHGTWPINSIDHINGIHGDNRLANLREASQSINMQNIRRPRADNKSGFLGVSWNSYHEAFEARIKSQGKLLNLGRFTNPAEAHQAYLAAKRQLHAGNTL